MAFVRLFLLCLSLSGFCLPPGPAVADGTEMELIGKGFAPPAYHDFCRRNGALCGAGSGARIIRLDAGKRAELERLNLSVNRRIIERSDRAVHGVDDDWSLPVKVGDCEDFAILKKWELMKRGWPSAALLLTVARQRFSNEGHVVLTVRTSAGDLVLDSRTNAIKDWSRTPYRYYARQSQRGGGWERIGRARPTAAVSLLGS